MDRIQALKDIIAQNPEDQDARLFLARELAAGGRHKEAVTEFRAYIENSGKEDLGAAWLACGLSLIELGLNEQARAALQSGLASAKVQGHKPLRVDLENALLRLDAAGDK